MNIITQGCIFTTYAISYITRDSGIAMEYKKVWRTIDYIGQAQILNIVFIALWDESVLYFTFESEPIFEILLAESEYSLSNIQYYIDLNLN